MTNNEKALELVQKCLDDWPYAATRVFDIMKRLEQVKALLKEQPEQKFFVDSDGKMTPLPIQKHGHWKPVQDYYDDEHWQCSACGCEWYLEAGTPEENDMHYCPECGAKMDGEVKQDGS